MGMDLFSIECEKFSYTICEVCGPRVDKLEQLDSASGIAVFASYINPSVVQYCNYPQVIPVSPFMTSECISVNYARDRLNESSNDAVGSSNDCFSDPIRPDMGEVSLIEGLSIARVLFSSADAVLIIAGAGMSADSGLATFRYELAEYSKCHKEDNQCTSQSPSANSSDLSGVSLLLGGGLSTADVCYTNRPEKAWYYDASIRRDSLLSKPHEGYHQLLDVLVKQGKDFFVLTSNIDHYFLRAGYPDDRIYESHGSIDRIQCAKPTLKGRCEGSWKWSDLTSYGREGPILDDVLLECDLATTPHCPSCGGFSRANISHETDLMSDIDESVRSLQKRHFWGWLRKFRPSVVDDRTQQSSKHKKSVKSIHRNPAVSLKGSSDLSIDKTSSCNNRPMKLLILEIGCGETMHGLRLESELLLSQHSDSGIKHSKLIRINPDLVISSIGPRVGVGVMGSSSLPSLPIPSTSSRQNIFLKEVLSVGSQLCVDDNRSTAAATTATTATTTAAGATATAAGATAAGATATAAGATAAGATAAGATATAVGVADEVKYSNIMIAEQNGSCDTSNEKCNTCVSLKSTDPWSTISSRTLELKCSALHALNSIC